MRVGRSVGCYLLRRIQKLDGGLIDYTSWTYYGVTLYRDFAACALLKCYAEFKTTSSPRRHPAIRLLSVHERSLKFGALQERSFTHTTCQMCGNDVDDARKQLSKYTFYSKSRLSIETDGLIERIRCKDKTLDVEDCFLAMEVWIEDAKDRSSSRYSGNISAARRAEEILDALEANRSWSFGSTSGSNRSSQPTVLIPIRSSFYDVVLQCYAVCGGGQTAAESAESLLDRMLNQCRRARLAMESTTNRVVVPRPPPPEPTTKTFNIVINTWSKSGADNAGLKAEVVLSKMRQWKLECDDKTTNDYYVGSLPNVLTWLSLMNAWSRRSTTQSRTRVVEILHKIKEDHDETKARLEAEGNNNIDQESLMKGADVCNSALKVFVDRKLGREGALKAEEIFRFYQHWHETDWLVSAPNARTYSLVLDAWAQCGTEEGAKRAQDILYAMINQYREGKGVLPHRVTFTTCMMAWARLKRPSNDAPEKAEALLLHLVRLYEEAGDEELKPDTDACNVVISCWTRAMERPDAIDRARQVFHKAKYYTAPDLVTYNTLLDGLSKRGRGTDALDVLEWLESSSTSLTPDRITYNSVLSAISRDRSRSHQDALAVLDKMKNASGSSTSRRGLAVKPDKRSYTAVLIAWKNCDNLSIQDVEKASLLVREMEEVVSVDAKGHDHKPDVFLLTCLIQVCSRVQGEPVDRARSLKIALDTMDKILDGRYGQPTENAYESIMRSVCFLCDEREEKTNLLHSIFSKCAIAGFVSVNIVRFMIQGQVWENHSKVSELDETWFRNVASHRRPRHRQTSSA